MAPESPISPASMLTALVAESTLSGGKNERWQRRFGSIGIFMAGAMVGAALTRAIAPWAPLLLALMFFSVALTGLTRQGPATAGS
jgi:uncharacterized membrane protein YoaK (UPF0700 family)